VDGIIAFCSAFVNPLEVEGKLGPRRAHAIVLRSKTLSLSLIAWSYLFTKLFKIPQTAQGLFQHSPYDPNTMFIVTTA